MYTLHFTHVVFPAAETGKSQALLKTKELAKHLLRRVTKAIVQLEGMIIKSPTSDPYVYCEVLLYAQHTLLPLSFNSLYCRLLNVLIVIKHTIPLNSHSTYGRPRPYLLQDLLESSSNWKRSTAL